MADTLATPFTAAWSEVDRVAPAVTAHPRVTIAATALAVAGGFAYYSRSALLRAAFCLLVTEIGDMYNNTCQHRPSACNEMLCLLLGRYSFERHGGNVYL